jgi:hypothetical protein
MPGSEKKEPMPKVALKGRVGTVLNQVLNMPHGTYNILVQPDEFSTNRTPTIVQSRDITKLASVVPGTAVTVLPPPAVAHAVSACYTSVICDNPCETETHVYFTPLMPQPAATANSSEVYMRSVPKSVKQVMSHPLSAQWIAAMHKELGKHRKYKIYQEITDADFAALPAERRKFILDHTIHSTWNFSYKHDLSMKARLCACGNEQQSDGENFSSPVVDATTIKLLLAMANQFDYEISTFDIEAAYLSSPNISEVWIRPPAEYNAPGVKLLKIIMALYGLRSSGLSFNIDLNDNMLKLGFTRSEVDPCLYTRDGLLVAFHVDDACVVSRDQATKNAFLEEFKKLYTITIDHAASHFLGVDIHRDRPSGTLMLNQSKYIDTILHAADMTDCNPTKCNTPMEEKLYLDRPVATPPECQAFPYAEIIGMLMWLCLNTRYDCAYAVTYLSKFNNAHDHSHIKAVKRILRYLRGTRDLSLTYHRDESKTANSVDNYLVAWSDADFASDPLTRRSVTGSIVTFNGSVILARSSRQKSVQLSTQAAELIALSETARRVAYIRMLAHELTPNFKMKPTILYGDNQASLFTANTQTTSDKVKHIDIRDRFIKQLVANKVIETRYSPTDYMLADIFTKALPAKSHWQHTIAMLGLDPTITYYPLAFKGNMLSS